jgi:hypothetical protein
MLLILQLSDVLISTRYVFIPLSKGKFDKRPINVIMKPGNP